MDQGYYLLQTNKWTMNNITSYKTNGSGTIFSPIRDNITSYKQTNGSALINKRMDQEQY